jgi:ssDNA-specific exonuclease RecJ
MATDDFVYYLLLKQEWKGFEKEFERIYKEFNQRSKYQPDMYPHEIEKFQRGYEGIQKDMEEKIKSKQGLINEKFAQMNKLAQEIQAELGF